MSVGRRSRALRNFAASGSKPPTGWRNSNEPLTGDRGHLFGGPRGRLLNRRRRAASDSACAVLSEVFLDRQNLPHCQQLRPAMEHRTRPHPTINEGNPAKFIVLSGCECTKNGLVITVLKDDTRGNGGA
jgi:hypothetical protein